MKKAAIFDMDGLMFDTQRVYDESWYVLAPDFGITIPDAFVPAITGTAGDVMENVIRTFFPSVDPGALMAALYERVMRVTEDHLPVKPGLYEILDFFQEKGVRVCVASGSRRQVIERNMRNTGIMDKIEFVLSSAEGGVRSKPDPDIFLRAAGRLGLPPEDCYVLEDSVGGALAGLAAGCSTIMVPDTLEPTPEILEGGAHICRTLLEARDRLAGGEF